MAARLEAGLLDRIILAAKSGCTKTEAAKRCGILPDRLGSILRRRGLTWGDFAYKADEPSVMVVKRVIAGRNQDPRVVNISLRAPVGFSLDISPERRETAP